MSRLPLWAAGAAACWGARRKLCRKDFKMVPFRRRKLEYLFTHCCSSLEITSVGNSPHFRPESTLMQGKTGALGRKPFVHYGTVHLYCSDLSQGMGQGSDGICYSCLHLNVRFRTKLWLSDFS